MLIEADAAESARVADGTSAGGPVFLVDTSPDLRYQALREGLTRVDAVLFTHTHADHIFGIDDLRSFNFINDCEIPVYGSTLTCQALETNFHYAFFPDPEYEGGAAPRLTIHRLAPYTPASIAGITVLPLPVFHGKMEVYGYRVGNFAYLTDCNRIPDQTRQSLAGLDVLILDGLRYRPHRTHFTLEEAAREAELIGAHRTYLTHVSHEVEHDEANAFLRSLTRRHLEMAYDGLVVTASASMAASESEPGGGCREPA